MPGVFCDTRGADRSICHPARRFPHGEAHEEREHNAGQADDDEGIPPAQVLIAPAADCRADRRPHRNRQRVERKGGAASSFRKVVGDERVRWWAATRFADGRADARERTAS